ncbi:MAG: ChbG/HpnK family deacetylase [Legionella sp.]|nr:ChbG/HpnK family deacetylase [Legionella sp.]
MVNEKNIELCADDFGFNPAVCRGILQLVENQRLSAVSCMMNSPSIKSFAPKLLPYQNTVQIGLHFNLTEGHFLTYPQKKCFTLNELLFKSHLRLLNASFIANEFKAQLTQFQDLFGKGPDFIDGHQHVHQFPMVRNVLLDLYKEDFKGLNFSVRSTTPALTPAQYQLKARILALTGGHRLKLKLVERHISHNPYFSGIYDFEPGTDYRSLFRHWLSLALPDTLIMCHPGEFEPNSDDAIAQTRHVELAYFSSNEFVADCKEYQIKLATGPTSRENKGINCH